MFKSKLRQNWLTKSSQFAQKTILLGFVVSALPLETNAAQINKKQIEPHHRENAIAQDLFNLFKGAIRYIEVANISDEQEVAIGKEIQQQLLSQQYDLYDNQQVQNYITNIGQELLTSNEGTRNIPYSFQVVASEEVNAFATPGGFVYVTTGLLQAADNQAQLASVVAHEIAHIEKKHSIKALKQAAIAQGIAETTGVSTSTLAQIGYQLAVDLPQSREHEYEADRVGLEILQQAGYPPRAFANFLQKLQGGNQPEFLRTHPTGTNRIEAIASEIESSQGSSSKGLDEANYRNNISSLL